MIRVRCFVCGAPMSAILSEGGRLLGHWCQQCNRKELSADESARWMRERRARIAARGQQLELETESAPDDPEMWPNPGWHDFMARRIAQRGRKIRLTPSRRERARRRDR